MYSPISGIHCWGGDSRVVSVSDFECRWPGSNLPIPGGGAKKFSDVTCKY